MSWTRVGRQIPLAASAHAARGPECARLRVAELAQTPKRCSRFGSAFFCPLVYRVAETDIHSKCAATGSCATHVAGRGWLATARSPRSRRDAGVGTPRTLTGLAQCACSEPAVAPFPALAAGNAASRAGTLLAST